MSTCCPRGSKTVRVETESTGPPAPVYILFQTKQPDRGNVWRVIVPGRQVGRSSRSTVPASVIVPSVFIIRVHPRDGKSIDVSSIDVCGTSGVYVMIRAFCPSARSVSRTTTSADHVSHTFRSEAMRRRWFSHDRPLSPYLCRRAGRRYPKCGGPRTARTRPSVSRPTRFHPFACSVYCVVLIVSCFFVVY